ncbi:hypothetical protein D3C78_1986760 [compost metagenome]
MLPRLNLLDDPQLAEMAEMLQKTLQGLSMNQLKSNESLRRKVHAETAQAVARMEAMMFPGFGASQLM